MRDLILAALVGAAIAGGLMFFTMLPVRDSVSARGRGNSADRQVMPPDELTAEATMGERAFNAVCADCHGERGAGKAGFGPPLIHKIYERSEHGDAACHLAVRNGVRAHHWTFGDMPPQSGLTTADVNTIVAYVREVQRANGIE